MKRLPDSEREIMMIIWDAEEPVSRSDIEVHLDKERKLTKTTVLSFLSRLEEKGFVKVERVGRNNYYSPRVRKTEYLKRESQTILSRMYGNSLKNFVTALYDGRKMSQSEIQELKEYLDELEEETL
ncbi:MAG: BlaI/MecI/CopY family transcriptional regulator [Lachnospiraceae bacterium]|nr:BlaI/MecI/CopY family transcriptional regulator [Lachnospiraceae bacterium]